MDKKIYLASPLGFSEVGRLFMYKKLVPLLEEKGLFVINPWKLVNDEELAPIKFMPYGSEKKEEWSKMNVKIAQKNTFGIDHSDYVLAVLDGVDVDSGTASEIGYAFARGKKIIGYRGDFRLSADNEGSIVNLQVEYFIKASGGTIVTSIEELKKLKI